MKFKKFLKTGGVSSLIFVTAFLSAFSSLPEKVSAQAAPIENPTSLLRKWDVSGDVKAIATSEDGQTAYIGGSFTQLQSEVQGGFGLTAAGTFDTESPVGVTGTVNLAIPDGHGGWYLAGPVTFVNDEAVEGGLVHVSTNGSLDTSFDPEITGGDVSAMLLSPNGNTLYIGGSFTSVGGQTRNRVAAINASTGQPTPWNPNIAGGTTPVVKSIKLGASGTTVYVGGTFSTVGGQSRNSLAEVDLTTGQPTAWNPSVTRAGGVNLPGTVATISLDSSRSTLYFGGDFQCINAPAAHDCGNPSATTIYDRFDLAAVSTVTGTRTSLNINANSPYTTGVRNLVIAPDFSRLYVQGSFYVADQNGQFRNGLMALDLPSGQISTSWIPALTGGNAMALNSTAGILYLVGMFPLDDGYGGTNRRRLVALETNSGAVSSTVESYPWAGPWSTTVEAKTVAIGTGGANAKVFVGGTDLRVKLARNNLASINVASGHPTSWNPNLNNGVLTLLRDGNTLYAGGNFTTVGGQARNRMAAFSLNNGQPTSWNPDANNGVFVYKLNPAHNTLYVGGNFTTIGGEFTGRALAEVSLSTGAPTAWRPNPVYPDTAGIYDLEFDAANNRLYAAGPFGYLAGVERSRIGAIDTVTGAPLDWDPHIGGSGAIYAYDIELDSANNVIYVGGRFNTVGGQTRNKIAAISTVTGQPTAWNPNIAGGTQAAVRSLHLDSTNNRLFAGGTFDTVGGQTYKQLAMINTQTGQPYSWVSLLGSSVTDYVGVLTFDVPTGFLHVGGNFAGNAPSGELSYAIYPINEEGSIACPADFNGDEVTDPTDIFSFLSAWFGGELSADANHSNALEVSDIFTFLNLWFIGC